MLAPWLKPARRKWIPESEASSQRLDAEVRALLENSGALDALAKGARARARAGAAQDIAGRISTLVGAGVP